MHKLTITSSVFPDTVFSIPSRWDELTGSQLRKVARLSRLPFSGPNLAKLFFVVLTEQLPFWKRFQLRWFYIVSSSLTEKAELLFLVDSFQSDRQLTVQNLPIIRAKTNKVGYRSVLLHGPTSQLGNVTFWEYIQAEKYYLNHLESVKQSAVAAREATAPKALPSSVSGLRSSNPLPSHLDKLIATLYRQPKDSFDPHADRDIRIPLSDQGMKWRLQIVARMDMETKLSVLMWFEGCRSHIQRSFPRIFPKPDESEKKSPRSVSSQTGSLSARERNGQHWIEMISELAGGMDRYDAIGNTPLWTAFTDITHRIIKSEKAKQELAKSNAKSRKR